MIYIRNEENSENFFVLRLIQILICYYYLLALDYGNYILIYSIFIYECSVFSWLNSIKN